MDIARDVAGEPASWSLKRTLLSYRLVHRAFRPYMTAALLSTSTVDLGLALRPEAVQFARLIKQDGVGGLVHSLSFQRSDDVQGYLKSPQHIKTEALDIIYECLRCATRLHVLHLGLDFGIKLPKYCRLFSKPQSFVYTQSRKSSATLISTYHLVPFLSNMYNARQLEIRLGLGWYIYLEPHTWPDDIIRLCRTTHFVKRVGAIEQLTFKWFSSALARDLLLHIPFQPIRLYVDLDATQGQVRGDRREQFGALIEALQDSRFTGRLQAIRVQIRAQSSSTDKPTDSDKLQSLLRDLAQARGIQTACVHIYGKSFRQHGSTNGVDVIPWLVKQSVQAGKLPGSDAHVERLQLKHRGVRVTNA